jgi:hypothetical protein
VADQDAARGGSEGDPARDRRTGYENETRDIIESIDVEHGRAAEPLFQRKYRKPILLAISIGMFNQLAGVNAILYYLNDIFQFAGFSKISSDRQRWPSGPRIFCSCWSLCR